MAGAVTTGQGTPWGAPTYQTPNSKGVSAPDYINNPSQYPNFDQSALANRAISNSNRNSAYENQQAMAKNAANAGGGKSSYANIQNRNLAANQQQTASDLQNQQALQGWQSQLGQMNSQNAFNANQFGQNIQQWLNQAQASQADKKNRQQMVGQFGPIGSFAELFGGY